MALLFLAQQAFMYKAKQGLEMYAFRKALQLSKSSGRGIDLTVIRDVVTPSFFGGLSRERIQASASVEANPWDVWNPGEDSSNDEGVPQDIGTFQLLQIGEAMIQRGYFIRIPPTRIKVAENSDSLADADWSWKTSSISEIDAQELSIPGLAKRQSSYKNNKTVSENNLGRSTYDSLETTDTNRIQIKFQTADKIKEDYDKNDWEGKITSKDKVAVENIPTNAIIILDEKLNRVQTTSVAHPN